jgi:cellulose synthase/poly-beta-1,6-N-acetylglucosamine synthase-like glycosyltransferase
MHNDIGYKNLILPELQRLWNEGKLLNFQNPFITIVIPCYNPDKKLFDRLMECVINQSIGSNSIKIIIVDDGSKESD